MAVKTRYAVLWMILVPIVAFFGFVGVGWLSMPSYPFGASHCCDKQFLLAFPSYADAHGGNYPAGESSPEASLSLLYPQYCDAGVLRGKSVPEAVVKAILARGERLGPDTCGWHYVEGLNVNDDPRIAILWDKNRLGHNGELMPDHATMVLFVNGERKLIGDAEWASFLIEQKALLAARAAGS